MKSERIRIDFTLEEAVPIGEDKDSKYFRLRLVPDRRSWERKEIDGEKGWFNILEEVFISDKVMADTIKTLKGVSITSTSVEIKDEQKYIEKSKKRVRLEHENE